MKKEIKMATNEKQEERIQKILHRTKMIKKEEAKKAERLKNDTNNEIKKIKEKKERIQNLLTLINTCLKNDYLPGSVSLEHNEFRSGNYKMGFVNLGDKDQFKKYEKVKYIGYTNNNKIEVDKDCNIKSIVVFKEATCTREVERKPTLNELETFNKAFEEFETNFLNYIDKLDIFE